MIRLSKQAAADLEQIRLRLLEMLVPLADSLEGKDASSKPADDQVLREALWSAAKALDPVVRDTRVPAGVDLNREDEATQKALYDFVMWDHFTPRTLEDTGDFTVPQHTPEESSLRVFFEYGRWFVTWMNLEVDTSRPEAERRELFVVEKDEHGGVYLAEV